MSRHWHSSPLRRGLVEDRRVGWNGSPRNAHIPGAFGRRGLFNDAMTHSVYLLWHRSHTGSIELAARVQPTAVPAPGEVVTTLPPEPEEGRAYVTCAAVGLPKRICGWIARGWIELMGHTADHGPPSPLRPGVAAAVLAALAESDDRLREVVRGQGWLADEAGLELAVGTALRDLGGWPREGPR